MGKQIDNELHELLDEFNRIRKPLLKLLTVHHTDYIFVPDSPEEYGEFIDGEYDTIEADAYKRLAQRIEEHEKALQVEELINLYKKATRSKQRKVKQILRG